MRVSEESKRVFRAFGTRALARRGTSDPTVKKRLR